MFKRLLPVRYLRKHSVAFVVIVLLILALLRALQGFNMCDDGFNLSGYRLVFSSPGSINYLFLFYWLINVGGLWNMLFGEFGIYGFRVLECIILAANTFFVWRLVHSFIKPAAINIGFMMAFSMLQWIEVFDYNAFSSFSAYLSILIIVPALLRNNRFLTYLSGFVLGLSFFVRLPNVSYCLLSVVFIFHYCYLPCGNKSLTFKLLFTAVLGCLSGVFVTFCYMYFMGHLFYFLEAVDEMFFLAGNTENTHGSGTMFRVLIYNNAHICLRFVLMSLCPLFTVVAFRRFGKSRWLRFICFVLLVLHLLLLIIFNTVPLYVTNAMAISACLYVAYVKQHEPAIVYTSILAMLTVLVLPLGSDGGVITFGAYSLWLALPFVPYAVSLWLDRFEGALRKQLMILMLATFGLYAARNIYNIYGPAYYEKSNRMEDVYAVEYPRVNVYMDKKTAVELDTLLDVLKTKVEPGDTTMFMGDTPMLYYITDTRPWLRNPWAWIFGYDYCVRQLDIVRKAGEKLPVVVCERVDLEGKDKRSALLQSFLTANEYVSYYAGTRFLIFLPPHYDFS